MSIPSDDPCKEFRVLTASGKLPKNLDDASPVDKQILVQISKLANNVSLIQEQQAQNYRELKDLRNSNDAQFAETFTATRSATAEASAARLETAGLRTDVVGIRSSIDFEIKPRLQGIEDKQTIANGSVGTLKAKMAILEKEKTKQTREMLTEVIGTQADEVANKGVWIIPKPDFKKWQTWVTLGGIIAFFGIERLIALIHLIGVLLSKIH